MDLGPALAETHVSIVFFVGDRAYKLKKPVSLAFCDLSTREARESICHREVELNRRLAPDVYLGVADVLGPDGKPCDHLVVMRRMPAERRLSSLVRAGAGVTDALRRIARVVAAFHSAAPTSPEIASAATREAVRSKWEHVTEQLHPFVGSVVDAGAAARIEELARRYIDGRGPLLEKRIAEGKVRDGHGDLLADDIFCLDDGPRILDCIEFDDTLRYGDVLADVAFLAMDLERLGAPELTGRFLASYREFAAETYPASLAHWYVAYRAHVRSMVACLRYAQGDETAGAEARVLQGIALRHLELGRVRLVCVGGLPGTGKSTLAAGISDAREWTLLRSDEVRKELAGLGHFESGRDAYGHGIYTSEMTERTYGELLARARLALEEGESVVCDASWNDARWREEADGLGRATASDVIGLRCDAPPEITAARITGRAGGASDATADVGREMAVRTDPWPEAHPVGTAGSPEASLGAALDVLSG